MSMNVVTPSLFPLVPYYVYSSRRSSRIIPCSSQQQEITTKSGVVPPPPLVCPICQTTPVSTTMRCSRCNRRFDTVHKTGIKNLTVTSGVPTSQRSFETQGPNSVELFKNPIISSLYERGWRQSFSWAGFPGVEEESRMALDVLRPICAGSPLVDMSCGSGLFTRRFLLSGEFPTTIAVDYSESMLRETLDLIQKDPSIDQEACMLVQADAARLPFATSSIKGIHAGAAIHCWPDPLNSMAEMSRVLSPGGVFVGTTFLSFMAPAGELLGNDSLFKGLRDLEPSYNSFRFWNEDELRDLCLCCGFSSFSVVKRQFRYIMFKAIK